MTGQSVDDLLVAVDGHAGRWSSRSWCLLIAAVVAAAALLLLLVAWMALHARRAAGLVGDAGRHRHHPAAARLLLGRRRRHRRRRRRAGGAAGHGGGLRGDAQARPARTIRPSCCAAARRPNSTPCSITRPRTLVAQQPQVLHNAQGQPIASPELVVVASLPKRSTGLDANVEIRGVGERAWELRPNCKIIDGRKFTPGLRELIVGKGAREQFAGLDVGSTLKLNGQPWTRGRASSSRATATTPSSGATPTWSARPTAAAAARTSMTVRLTDAEALRRVQGRADDRPAPQGRRADDHARLLQPAVRAADAG